MFIAHAVCGVSFFILSGLFHSVKYFFKYFSVIFESKLSDILFCCIVFLAILNYFTRLSFRRQVLFKVLFISFDAVVLRPICRSSGACIYYQDSSASSSTLSRTIRHFFYLLGKECSLYLEALSLPHALEFFVFCCFSACLPLDLQ